jgi:hypothetical protein
MKSAESKTTAAAQHLQAKQDEPQTPFFQAEKAGSALDNGHPSFFSPNGGNGIQRKPFFSSPRIQTKLTIGQPGDKYEQEADHMADQVVQRLAEPNRPVGTGPESETRNSKPLSIQRKSIFESNAEPSIQAKFQSSTAPTTPLIQAKCDDCEQEEKLQKKEEPGLEEQVQMKPIFESNAEPPETPLQPKLEHTPFLQKQCAECAAEEENPGLQKQADSTASTAATPNLESRLSSSRGGGSPLPENTRTQMEGAFGSDFSGVRVHTDSSAVQMNKELGAQAFTHGSDVYFGAGKYDDGSTEGKRLLGHELTHVVQQNEDTVFNRLNTQSVPNLQAQTVGERPSIQHRVSTMIALLIEWEASGLLSSPYLPPGVGTIPPIPVTAEEANSMASAAPLIIANLAVRTTATEASLGAGATALETAAARWGTAAVIEGGASSASLLTRIALVSAEVAPPVAFFTVLLWPSSTAPAWMDTLNPITGSSYASPREYDWIGRLTLDQKDYLSNLNRARRLSPDTAIDGETGTEEEPEPVPQPLPAPQEDEDDPSGCIGRNVRRRGGHARHDAYATRVTGSTLDYNVWPGPPSLSINYDGKSYPRLVWEVKTGYGWFFNPSSASLRDIKLAEWDAQKNLGLFIAQRCGYFHLWSIPDRWVAALLNTRWGGVPPVLNIPE